MPQLLRKSFVRPKSAPGSQQNKISNLKTFKTPLLAKENIAKILKNEMPIKDIDRRVSYSQSSLKSFEEDQIIASSASILENKKCNVPKTTPLKRVSSNASSISVHLSFEDINGKVIDDSDKSDISYRMNEPKIKDAYLQFVKKLSQSSSSECKLTSSPKSQKSIVLTPAQTQESPELFTTPAMKSPLKIKNEKDKQSLLGNDTKVRKYLSPKRNKRVSKKMKRPLLGEDNEEGPSPPKRAKKINSKSEDNVSCTSFQSQEKMDSGISLSQELLNRADVKAAYVNFMKSSLNNEDITKPKKAIKSEKNNIITSSGEESIDKSLEKVKKAVPKRANKGKKNLKRKSEEKDIEEESLTVQERMSLIQESRNVGLYVLCDICNKARYLPNVKDPLELPDKWYCAMHPDEKYNKCSYPEEILEDEEYLIDNLYNAGSIVWVKMYGYPWWPAMVEDDVDTETYFWLDEHSKAPTWYHVTFFDSAEVTRAWMRPSCLKPFKINMNNLTFQTPEKNRYKIRVAAAFKQAVDALSMPLIDRLKKYSFIYRYSKPVKMTANREEKRGKNKSRNQVRKTKKKLAVGRNLNLSNQGEFGVPVNSDFSLIINEINWTDSQNLSFNLLQ